MQDSASKFKSKNQKENIYIFLISTLIYIGCFIFAIVQLFNPNYSVSLARLIILQSIGCTMIPLAFPLLEKVFNVTLHLSIKLFLVLFGLLNCLFGEVMEFYYVFHWWDDFLHFLSGGGVAMLAFLFMLNYTKKSMSSNRFLMCVVVGIMFSFSLAVLWEIYEFSADCLFGTNMQKSIPELDYLFNGGNSSAPLLGSDEAIANFFRKPDGYRYALMDTMGDFVCCFIGNVVYVIVTIICNKCNALGKMSYYINYTPDDIEE
ncbi:MAG: hypothetical protein K2I42_05820 [Anaeroplasmataceae bacterium]|nr:hypothetical protein [Anaeroplasmataceae bacterium]